MDDTCFHCISPMSLQDRAIFTDKQHLAADFARSPRTVSPGERWCKLICARRTGRLEPKWASFDRPIRLEFKDVCLYIWD